MSPAISGSPAATSRLAMAAKASPSSGATPIISEIVHIGSRRETCSTASQSPRSTSSSTTARAWARIWASIVATRRGVKAEATSRRSLACRGASIARKDWEASSSSGGASPYITPRPEQKVCGSLLTATTSAWRTTAQ